MVFSTDPSWRHSMLGNLEYGYGFWVWHVRWFCCFDMNACAPCTRIINSHVETKLDHIATSQNSRNMQDHASKRRCFSHVPRCCHRCDAFPSWISCIRWPSSTPFTSSARSCNKRSQRVSTCQWHMANMANMANMAVMGMGWWSKRCFFTSRSLGALPVTPKLGWWSERNAVMDDLRRPLAIWIASWCLGTHLGVLLITILEGNPSRPLIPQSYSSTKHLIHQCVLPSIIDFHWQFWIASISCTQSTISNLVLVVNCNGLQSLLAQRTNQAQ